ncbi:MAG TPA: TRAP transporter substrate-binding protein [Geopsychrobacteraceae bacterium]|nr:TRAP transporter substrate-binding protein [Geopsychrobacteraceae bacterium]
MRTVNRLIQMLLVAVLVFGLAACNEKQEQQEQVTEAPKVEKEKIIWKLAMTWPANTPILSEAVTKMAEDVKRMSDGELEIRIDSANKHKAPFGVLDMVKAGQYEMGNSASYYWKGKDINTMFFTSMPFGMIAPEQYAWFYYGGGIELMKKVYDQHGVYAFPGGNTSNQMGGWFRKEITSLDDLNGLKMRIPGFAGEVISKLGTVVTNIPPGELYTALDRGTIDALEWIGPSLDLNMGFHKVAPYYYTGWHEPASEMQFLVNQQKFDELPPHLQAILTNAMQLAAYDMYAHMIDVSAKNWATIQQDYPDVKLRTFPKEVIAKLKEENIKLLDEQAEKNELFKEILTSQRDYLKKVREWTRISDYAYLKDNIEE